MLLLILSIFLLVVHLFWAGNRLMDLFTKSRRKNKIQWMLIILLLPIIGAVAYNLTMRRQKLSRRTLLF